MSVEVHPTRYEASELPLGHVERSLFTISIEYTGTPGTDQQWAVRNGCRCLSASGEWVYEPLPSERDAEFFANHRFTLERATELAVQEVPKLVVNGWTARAVLERNP